MVGFERYLFISLNACCYEGPEAKSLFIPLSAWNIGRLHSTDFEKNLFRAASLPINFWTSFMFFGTLIFIIAWTLSGLGSMPFADTMQSRIFSF